jgi:transcriptional regulator with XRE-family HTH domain
LVFRSPVYQPTKRETGLLFFTSHTRGGNDAFTKACQALIVITIMRISDASVKRCIIIIFMPGVLKHEPKIIFDEKAVGTRIAELRQANGLTQHALADKIGINRALISDYERGKVRIYGDMIARIALALKVTTDDILGLKSNALPKQIPSLKLMKRLYEMDKLPNSKQKALLTTIDNFLKAEGMK